MLLPTRLFPHPVCATLLAALLLALLPAATTRAQGSQLSSFVDMQNEMMHLMDRQIPLLQQLVQEAETVWKEVSSISELLANPRNIEANRASSLSQLILLRKRNDQIQDKLKGYWFAWQRYNNELMAVYTRFGEMKAQDRMDPNLRHFLLLFRELDQLMSQATKQAQETYSECDFLLNTKLN